MHIVAGVAAGAALGLVIAFVVYRVGENFDRQLMPLNVN